MGEHVLVRCAAQPDVAGVDSVMSYGRESASHGPRQRLVHQEGTHSDSPRMRANDFVFRKPGSIPKRRTDLIGSQVVLVAEFLFGDTGRELAEDQRDRNTSAGDHGFAERHLRICSDSGNDLGRHATQSSAAEQTRPGFITSASCDACVVALVLGGPRARVGVPVGFPTGERSAISFPGRRLAPARRSRRLIDREMRAA
jgi:hypothetical protein